MKRFKKILCFVGGRADPSPALDVAADLARRNAARLTLVDVLPESTEGPWLTVPGRPELEKVVVTSRLQDLEEMAARLGASGAHAEVEVAVGSPFVELIRRVVVDGHDLVIKTAQNPEPTLGGPLGTTALHLMRKCPAPVWVVKPDTSERFGRVLAAVDLRPAEADQRAASALPSEAPLGAPLSAKVLQLAGSLATATGSKLEVVHAWWLESEAALRGRRVGMSPAQVDSLLRQVRGTAEAALDALVERVDFGRPHFEVHLVKGQPDEVIGRFAARSDIAVMGTLSRTGVDGLLIGNTAERILRRVECSVLAVKPDGFRTPLRFDEAPARAGAAVDGASSGTEEAEVLAGGRE